MTFIEKLLDRMLLDRMLLALCMCMGAVVARIVLSLFGAGSWSHTMCICLGFLTYSFVDVWVDQVLPHICPDCRIPMEEVAPATSACMMCPRCKFEQGGGEV